MLSIHSLAITYYKHLLHTRQMSLPFTMILTKLKWYFSVLNCYIISDDIQLFVILHKIYTVLNFWKHTLTTIHRFAQNRSRIIKKCLGYPSSIMFLLLKPHHPCVTNKIATCDRHIVITGIALRLLELIYEQLSAIK